MDPEQIGIMIGSVVTTVLAIGGSTLWVLLRFGGQLAAQIKGIRKVDNDLQSALGEFDDSLARSESDPRPKRRTGEFATIVRDVVRGEVEPLSAEIRELDRRVSSRIDAISASNNDQAEMLADLSRLVLQQTDGSGEADAVRRRANELSARRNIAAASKTMTNGAVNG